MERSILFPLVLSYEFSLSGLPMIKIVFVNTPSAHACTLDRVKCEE